MAWLKGLVVMTTSSSHSELYPHTNSPALCHVFQPSMNTSNTLTFRGGQGEISLHEILLMAWFCALLGDLGNWPLGFNFSTMVWLSQATTSSLASQPSCRWSPPWGEQSFSKNSPGSSSLTNRWQSAWSSQPLVSKKPAVFKSLSSGCVALGQEEEEPGSFLAPASDCLWISLVLTLPIESC